MPMPPDRTAEQLNAEWAAAWAHVGVPEAWPQHPASFGEVLAGIAHDADPRLAALLRLAPDDARAGRVVLHAVLGKLVLLARDDRRHGLADYVAECWLQICRYPLQRRPLRIAANLTLDTRAALWRTQPVVHTVDAALLDEVSALQPADPVSVVRAAVDLGLIDRASAACLAAVYCFGLRSHEAGAQLSLSADTVRWRNSRALRRLAAHATQLAEAA